MSKEHPAPFNIPMVRAILEDRKTHTRRIAGRPSNGWSFETDDRGSVVLGKITSSHPKKGRFGAFIRREIHPGSGKYGHDIITCPFGQPGDLLWVRESARVLAVRGGIREIDVEYQADGHFATVPYPSRLAPAPLGKLLANGTYRESSRILLEITNIRIERLQDISDEDAIAEGLKAITKDGKLVKYGIPDRDGYPGTDNTGWPWDEWCVSPVDAYRKLWDAINSPGSWEANPWVWVIEFRAVKP